MITIKVEPFKLFNEETERFMTLRKPQEIQLEHSLISISKWEAKWHKPFLDDVEKTSEEMMDYIQCMTINSVDPVAYLGLTEKNIKDILEYIENPMTATWFSKKNKAGRSRRKVTSEVIYGWMVTLQIPFSAEKWHINRLLTLVQVIDDANNPQKMSKRETAAMYAKLNAERKKKMNTKG